MKKSKKPVTNEQLIKGMMKSLGVASVLKQAFIIEAISKYSEMVLADKSDWSESFISKDIWDACARECLNAIKNRG